MMSIEEINIDAVRAGTPVVYRVAVDLTVLAGYEKIQIDEEPDFIVELIDLYRADAPRRLAAMQDALVKENWLTVKQEAHGLRGSSASLGIFVVAEICDEIEGIESAEPFASLAPLLVRLELALQRALCILLAERHRRSQ
jgi:HPt (histidine-containing phosphotransfer) domain-containing protein